MRRECRPSDPAICIIGQNPTQPAAKPIASSCEVAVTETALTERDPDSWHSSSYLGWTCSLVSPPHLVPSGSQTGGCCALTGQHLRCLGLWRCQSLKLCCLKLHKRMQKKKKISACAQPHLTLSFFYFLKLIPSAVYRAVRRIYGEINLSACQRSSKRALYSLLTTLTSCDMDTSNCTMTGSVTFSTGRMYWL